MVGVVSQVAVDPELIGCIIGKKGVTIQRIRQETGQYHPRPSSSLLLLLLLHAHAHWLTLAGLRLWWLCVAIGAVIETELGSGIVKICSRDEAKRDHARDEVLLVIEKNQVGSGQEDKEKHHGARQAARKASSGQAGFSLPSWVGGVGFGLTAGWLTGAYLSVCVGDVWVCCQLSDLSIAKESALALKGPKGNSLREQCNKLEVSPTTHHLPDSYFPGTPPASPRLIYHRHSLISSAACVSVRPSQVQLDIDGDSGTIRLRGSLPAMEEAKVLFAFIYRPTTSSRPT